MAQHEDNGTENGAKERKAHKLVYSTLEECQAVTGIPSDKFRIYQLEDANGTVVGWSWAFTSDSCLTNLARHLGYTASAADGKRGTMTPETAAAKLLALDDATLAALGLTRKKGKK